MALSKIDVANMLTGATPVANGGTALTSGFANGVTVADSWRLTSNVTDAVDPIASNLEQSDTDGAGQLGSAMTVSSGIFTFPSTGFWLIIFTGNTYLNGDSRHHHLSIHTTTDNSSYNLAATGYTFIQQTSSNTTQSSATCHFLFDVTNVTTHKCKFVFENVQNSSTILEGSTGTDDTCFKFIRLGDT